MIKKDLPLHWTDHFSIADESLLFSNHNNYAIRFYNIISSQSATGVRLAPSGWPSAATRDPNEVKKERFSGAPACKQGLLQIAFGEIDCGDVLGSF